MKKIFILSLVLFINAALFAQVQKPVESTKPVEKTKETKMEKPADEKLSFVFKGKVKDAMTKKKIYDATVTLKGSDGSVEIVKTMKNGKYIFDKKPPLNTPYLKANTSYTLEVKKEGYKTAFINESTEGNEQETFILDFLLEQEPE